MYLTPEHAAKNVRRVYYLSLEYLMGRVLSNNLVNLGLRDVVSHALAELGQDLETIADEEAERVKTVAEVIGTVFLKKTGLPFDPQAIQLGPKDADFHLHDLIETAVNRGLFTGDSPMEVESHSYNVERLQ